METSARQALNGSVCSYVSAACAYFEGRLVSCFRLMSQRWLDDWDDGMVIETRRNDVSGTKKKVRWFGLLLRGKTHWELPALYGCPVTVDKLGTSVNLLGIVRKLPCYHLNFCSRLCKGEAPKKRKRSGFMVIIMIFCLLMHTRRSLDPGSTTNWKSVDHC